MLVAVSLAQLATIRTDNSVQGFLHPTDPARLAYEEFRDRFGRDDLVVIGVGPATVFDLAFIEKLRGFHEELERTVPHADSITSLVNARWTRSAGDELVIGSLLASPPQTTADLRALEQRVRENPLYRNTLLSDSGRLTTVTIVPRTRPTGARARALQTDPVAAELVGAVREAAALYDGPDFPIHIAGAPVATERLDFALRRDVVRLAGLSMLSNVAVLYWLFGSLAGVLLPLAVVIPSILCTLGAMVMIGIPFSLTTAILPTFLLVVGVCDAMHLLVLFFQRLRAGETRADAIAHAMGHSGLAIVMTTLTTAGGLFSFAFAEIATVSHFGVAAPIGVMLALLFTVVLLPALLAVVPLGQLSRREGTTALERTVVAIGRLGARRPVAVLAGATLVFGFAVSGISQLRFGQNQLEWFPRKEPLRIATELLDRELGGVLATELWIEAHDEDAFQQPAALEKLDALAQEAKSLQHGALEVGQTVSLADLVREVHRALGGTAGLPDDAATVAQQLLLFESMAPDELMRRTDVRFSAARLTLRVPRVDTRLFPPFLDELELRASERFGDGVDVRTTGMAAMMGRVLSAVVDSLAQSYAIALVVIVPMMIFAVGNLRRGLVSMLPNLLPVAVALGIMGWFGIAVDAFSLLIGCIIIGLAVDDTIHFMHVYGRTYAASGDVEASIRETLATTGAALLFTSLVLLGGCVAFAFAYMASIAAFGVLIGIAIIVAFVADVLLCPALLVLIDRRPLRLAER